MALFVLLVTARRTTVGLLVTARRTTVGPADAPSGLSISCAINDGKVVRINIARPALKLCVLDVFEKWPHVLVKRTRTRKSAGEEDHPAKRGEFAVMFPGNDCVSAIRMQATQSFGIQGCQRVHRLELDVDDLEQSQ
jgi:hypothetical protein